MQGNYDGYLTDYIWYHLDGVSVTVSTDSSTYPNVSATNPSGGNIGDTNVPIVLYGQNLLNSDGAMPAFASERRDYSSPRAAILSPRIREDGPLAARQTARRLLPLLRQPLRASE